MLKLSIVACAAAIVISSTTAVFAYEDPENKLGDRYPFLEQRYQSMQVSRYAVAPRQVVILNQYSNESAENKLSDRYPLLEQAYTPIASSAVRYSAVRSSSSLSQYANEAPENKISDRYPLLETQVAYRSGPTARTVASRRSATIR